MTDDAINAWLEPSACILLSTILTTERFCVRVKYCSFNHAWKNSHYGLWKEMDTSL